MQRPRVRLAAELICKDFRIGISRRVEWAVPRWRGDAWARALSTEAQIEPLGVVYAVNIKAHGKLVFLPMARVLAAVGKR